jgi:hypothetical protein
MNILRKGRLYSDEPAHAAGEASDKYALERVSLLVARNGTKGRWEAHRHSRIVMQRLDAIGRGKTTLNGLSISGKAIGAIYVGALNLYLKACNGLTSFRRDRVVWATRADFVSLLSRVGINYHSHVARPQSADQIPAGADYPSGPGGNCL